MKTRNFRNYLAVGLSGIFYSGIGGCGNFVHVDCFPNHTDNFHYETREECEANDGDWGLFGLNDKFRCNMRTSDYGNSCDAYGDCEGVCIADENAEGHCSEYATEFGCYTEIVNCGELREICRD